MSDPLPPSPLQEREKETVAVAAPPEEHQELEPTPLNWMLLWATGVSAVLVMLAVDFLQNHLGACPPGTVAISSKACVEERNQWRFKRPLVENASPFKVLGCILFFLGALACFVAASNALKISLVPILQARILKEKAKRG